MRVVRRIFFIFLTYLQLGCDSLCCFLREDTLACLRLLSSVSPSECEPGWPPTLGKHWLPNHDGTHMPRFAGRGSISIWNSRRASDIAVSLLSTFGNHDFPSAIGSDGPSVPRGTC